MEYTQPVDDALKIAYANLEDNREHFPKRRYNTMKKILEEIEYYLFIFPDCNHGFAKYLDKMNKYNTKDVLYYSVEIANLYTMAIRMIEHYRRKYVNID